MSTVPRVQCTTISSLRSNVPPNPWILCTTPWSNVQLSLGSNVPPLRFNVPSCTTNIPLWSNVLYVVPCEQLTRIIDYHHRLPSPINATNQSPSSSSIVDHQFNHIDQDHRLLSPITITNHRSQSSITDPITLTKIIDYHHRFNKLISFTINNRIEEEQCGTGILTMVFFLTVLVIGEKDDIIMVKWLCLSTCHFISDRFIDFNKWYRYTYC